MIVHDAVGEELAMDTIQEEPEPESEDPKGSLPPQPVRTRKAKDLQTKLGVGRPKAAGGTGARAITKSTSVPRGRRGKSSRTTSKVDETIPEGLASPFVIPSEWHLPVVLRDRNVTARTYEGTVR